MLVVKNVKKSYETDAGPVRVLKGVNLEVNSGELVAIMGPSGCGKSTLLNILGLFHQPDSGAYIVDSKDVFKMSRREQANFRRKYVGFVLQAANLLENTTVYENLEFPLIYSGMKSRLRRDMIEKALSIVGLDHRINHPSKYLSGGEQQRVAIARALVGQPKIILGDEPTGQLDRKNSKMIMEYFQRVATNAETGMIIVTHDRGVARDCSKVYNLQNGILEEVSVGRRRS